MRIPIVRASKLKFVFNPLFAEIAVQAFIDPIVLRIAGVTLLEMVGCKLEEKFDAMAHIAAVEEKKAAQEEEERKKQEEERKVGMCNHRLL